MNFKKIAETSFKNARQGDAVFAYLFILSLGVLPYIYILHFLISLLKLIRKCKMYIFFITTWLTQIIAPFFLKNKAFITQLMIAIFSFSQFSL